MNLNTIIEEMKKEDVVICDGLLTGQLGKVIGVGSSEHSIKLLVDGIERYEPDYALLYITNENKKALALLVSHITTTAQRVRENTIEEVKDILIGEGYLMSKELIAHDTTKKNHGTCCYCGTCGHDKDYCVCSHNELIEKLSTLNK